MVFGVANTLMVQPYFISYSIHYDVINRSISNTQKRLRKKEAFTLPLSHQSEPDTKTDFGSCFCLRCATQSIEVQFNGFFFLFFLLFAHSFAIVCYERCCSLVVSIKYAPHSHNHPNESGKGNRFYLLVICEL